MAKTSSMKGYQKKTSRAAARMQRDILGGKHAPTLSIDQLLKDFELAGQGAEKIFSPIKENAIAEFEQLSQPQTRSQFGAQQGQGSRSSALNQALSAARGNLSRQLTSDFSTLQTGIAQNLLGQRETNQTNQLNTLANLSQQGAFQNPYKQKQGGTSGIGGQLIGGGLSALGTYAGTEAGASALSAALPALFAAFSSKEVKENIRDYDKGIEEIRNMDVKQYDYTIPVQGKQKGRIGLIAEDMPQEIQDSINGINAVDVYGLVAILVNAVKQLDKKIKDLEATHVASH